MFCLVMMRPPFSFITSMLISSIFSSQKFSLRQMSNWTQWETMKLLKTCKKQQMLYPYFVLDWVEISTQFPKKSPEDCRNKYKKLLETPLKSSASYIKEIGELHASKKRPRWSATEDERLLYHIKRFADSKDKWSKISQIMGDKSEEQCKYRWYKKLKSNNGPDIAGPIRKKRTRITHNELISWPKEDEISLLVECDKFFKKSKAHSDVPSSLPTWLYRQGMNNANWTIMAKHAFDDIFKYPLPTIKKKWRNELYYTWVLYHCNRILETSKKSEIPSLTNRNLIAWCSVENSILLLGLKILLNGKLQAYKEVPPLCWKIISLYFLPHRSPHQIESHFHKNLDPRVSLGTWSNNETSRLILALKAFNMDFNKAIDVVNKDLPKESLPFPYNEKVSKLYAGPKIVRNKRDVRQAMLRWSFEIWTQKIV